jgi:hypothetical protein
MLKQQNIATSGSFSVEAGDLPLYPLSFDRSFSNISFLLEATKQSYYKLYQNFAGFIEKVIENNEQKNLNWQ